MNMLVNSALFQPLQQPIAAIYARKSTDDNHQVEAHKSVERQVEQGRLYAAEQGFQVPDDMVFIDDGISGAEFINRPGLSRMLNSLSCFQALIVSEESRLGRDSLRTALTVDEVLSKGVRIHYYLSREVQHCINSQQKMMTMLKTFIAEQEREKNSQRTSDALRNRARKGYVAGGRVYGYDNVQVTGTAANGEVVRSHTEYAINAEEAEVVRSLFRMYLDGHGLKAIAKTLNLDPNRDYPALSRQYFDGRLVASPTKGTGSWSPTAVREMLTRERYLGRIVYGKVKKVYLGGTQKRIQADPEQTIQLQREDLRIIDDESWHAVQARLKRMADESSGTGHFAPSKRGSRYLLSGLARCGVCGASLTVVGGTTGSGENRVPLLKYGCSFRQNRGARVCNNNHTVRVEMLDQQVLLAIQQQVLTPEAMDYVVNQALTAFHANHAPARKKNQGETRQKQIQKLEKEIANLVNFVAKGNLSSAISHNLAQKEAQLSELQNQ